MKIPFNCYISRRTLWVAIIASTLITACKHDPFIGAIGPEGGNPFVDTNQVITPSGIPCNEDSVYFENQILPLLTSNCGQPGCHNSESAEDGVVLTDYWNILNTGEIDVNDPTDSEIYEVITDNDPNDRMPPSPETPLTQEEINMILTWISQGAQNNYCESCDTTQATFSQTIQPLVQLKCQGCHSGSNPGAGISLTSYANISAAALDGSLLSSVLGESGFTQMPYNSAPLSDCEIGQIELWIQNGALND